ncbi:hypothetical protein ACIQ9Q_17110 [Streptomyces sp. NPDC094438]|uniref:hypothetical protein n=1 Tax=Streptomyces sp. NPDC094438 TaxID=3366061 RepID=UPI0037F4CA69
MSYSNEEMRAIQTDGQQAMSVINAYDVGGKAYAAYAVRRMIELHGPELTATDLLARLEEDARQAAESYPRTLALYRSMQAPDGS